MSNLAIVNEEYFDEILSDKKVVNFPMSSQQCYLKNKKCDYKTLAIMTLFSNMTPYEIQDKNAEYEKYRYIYKNKIIKFTNEIEDMSGNKINTIVKNMRKLSKLENNNLISVCKNEAGDIYYVINYCDENDRRYVTIEHEILRMLINACSSNAIKIYILLKYLCNTKEKKITRDYIAEQIGLSKNANNRMVVTDCTNVLSRIGLISKREDYAYGNDIKCDVYYKVRTYNEWKEYDIKEKK